MIHSLDRRSSRRLRSSSRGLVLLAAWVALACNVDDYDTTTTGVSLREDPAAPAGSADPRGYFVVGTDYQSTSVSLVGVDGSLDSPVLIGSASAAPGLSAALGGDVVPPSSRLPGNEVVLIDRLPASVLSWVDLETASVRAQLNVSTGFGSNPQDYVPLAADKAYVPRLEENLARGSEPFDRGSDVLIIDPSVPAVLGSIDLWPALDGEDPSFLPRPSRALGVGERVLVLALAATSDYSAFAATRLVSIDPARDAIDAVLVLDGLTNCTSLVPSPSGGEVAIGCSGSFGQDPALGFPDAGIAIVDVGLQQARRYPAAELGGEAIGAVAYASASSLVFTTYGRYALDFTTLEAPDTLRRLDLARGPESELLAQTSVSAFSFGDVRCAPDAGRCVLADAESDGGTLRLFSVDAEGRLADAGSVQPNPGLGLPPRYLGAY